MSRILIIEDDEAVRLAIRDVLETEGHEILLAACGATGRLTPVHFYSEAGTYIVTLVVVDEQGALSRAHETIEILE